MEVLDTAIEYANKLGSVSLASLLVLILVGHYREVWMWGKTHRADIDAKNKRIAEKNAEIREWKLEVHEWRRVALGGHSLAKSAFASAMSRPPEQPLREDG